MAIWSLTKAEVISRIETVVRRLGGQETPTYSEKKLIEDAFNAAIVDMCIDRGIPRWRAVQSDYTASTTSGTSYVDLDANIFNIITGTVRIEGEDATLAEKSLEAIYSGDPGIESSGRPIYYALDASSDPETIRLRLWPQPDSSYTISFVGESIPDEDSIASLPSWMHGALKDKSTENALRDLGFLNESRAFAASYERRKHDAKASEGTDAPLYINRVGPHRHLQDVQDRMP